MQAVPHAFPVVLLLAAASPAQTWHWQRVDGPDGTMVLPPINGAAMTTDTARGRVVLCEAGVTWEWDGYMWLARASNAPHGFGALVYDTQRHRVISVGSGRTWIWDGNVGTDAGAAPSTAIWPALSYDSRRDRVVLWTGQVSEWDGMSWSLRGSNAAGDRLRIMAFDPSRGLTIAVALDSLGTPSTWTWDGVNWTQVDQPGSLPVPLGMAACVWHPGRGRVVLVSGTGMFEWDGQRWLLTSSQPPPTMSGWFFGGLAHDPVNGALLVYGTNHPSGLPARETWSWNGSAWTLLAVTGDTRSRHAMGYDPTRNRLVLTGGYVFNVGRHQGTATWNGSNWTLANAAVAPLRGDTAMAWDPNRQGLLLFGGEDDGGAPFSYNTRADSWLWNGQSWSQIAPSQSPPARAYHAMVLDDSRQRVILHGGLTGPGSGPRTVYGDTWEWDGATWTPRGTGPVRARHALACDPVRQRVVLFGGIGTGANALDDTWEWDGTTWTLQTTVGRPPASVNHGMAFDRVRRYVVLAVPVSPPNSLEAWTWDGNWWLPLQVAVQPPVVDAARVAFDASAGRIVMHNGGSLFVLTETAAGSEPFGSGCRGLLLAMGRPRIDTSFRVDLQQAPMSAPTVVGFAGGETNRPLGNGCTLLVLDPFVLRLTVTNADGFGSTVVDVPQAPALRGARFAAQAAFLAPAPPGIALSNGLRLLVGD